MRLNKNDALHSHVTSLITVIFMATPYNIFDDAVVRMSCMRSLDIFEYYDLAEMSPYSQRSMILSVLMSCRYADDMQTNGGSSCALYPGLNS